VNDKYLYLTIDLLSISVPLIFSFYPKNNFYKKWRWAWPAILLTAFMFVLWDHWFTRMGVWGFNSDYITGYYFSNLPLEEVLFFICVPYACLFVYDAVNTPVTNAIREKIHPVLSDLLALFLLITGIIYHSKWYTSVTFISLGSVLLFLKWVMKVSWKGKFYLAWILILIPFFIVNGILTGTGIHSPVVWYNDTENLGWRIGTIPVEDAFYGMLLILVNVSIYERLKKYDL
jgi:lycopene cyclase domain-containing protein